MTVVWATLGLIGVAMTVTGLAALILIIAVRVARDPNRGEPGHIVYLVERDDPVFAYQLDKAIRRYEAGGRG